MCLSGRAWELPATVLNSSADGEQPYVVVWCYLSLVIHIQKFEEDVRQGLQTVPQRVVKIASNTRPMPGVPT